MRKPPPDPDLTLNQPTSQAKGFRADFFLIERSSRDEHLFFFKPIISLKSPSHQDPASTFLHVQDYHESPLARHTRARASGHLQFKNFRLFCLNGKGTGAVKEAMSVNLLRQIEHRHVSGRRCAESQKKTEPSGKHG